MNLFVLDENPCVAAIMHCDKHVVKMHTEAVQMLVSSLNELGIEHNVLNAGGLIHAGGYRFHPVTRWVLQRPQNWEWTLAYGLALCYQHYRRYGKVVMSHEQLVEIRKHRWMVRAGMVTNAECELGESFNAEQRERFMYERTPFVQAMPDKYQQKDAVAAYRDYYCNDKRFAVWNKGVEAPQWFQDFISKKDERLS